MAAAAAAAGLQPPSVANELAMAMIEGAAGDDDAPAPVRAAKRLKKAASLNALSTSLVTDEEYSAHDVFHHQQLALAAAENPMAQLAQQQPDLAGILQQMNQNLGQINGRLANLELGMQNVNARQHNSTCYKDDDPLLPLHTAAGVAPDFPPTRGQLATLGNNKIAALLAFYGVPAHADDDAAASRRLNFQLFIGVRL
mmetsp:Transcript_10662/g.23511  ORF Transcript_10662/g.23511 Transcript_10662/m.23511 type:complete len:198 (+) Transcript_10662:1-594(+)